MNSIHFCIYGVAIKFLLIFPYIEIQYNKLKSINHKIQPFLSKETFVKKYRFLYFIYDQFGWSIVLKTMNRIDNSLCYLKLKYEMVIK